MKHKLYKLHAKHVEGNLAKNENYLLTVIFLLKVSYYYDKF